MFLSPWHLHLCTQTHPVWKPPPLNQHVLSDLLCQPTEVPSDSLIYQINRVPPADDEDRKLQHTSLRRAVAIYVATTTLPLHPGERPSPISALNNGFRFLFILPRTLVFLSPPLSLCHLASAHSNYSCWPS